MQSPPIVPQPLPSVPVLLGRGLRSALRRPGTTFGVLPGTAVLGVCGCLLPWVNFPFILLALAPLVGALPTLALAVAKDDPVGRWGPFEGFRRFERWLGLFWIPYLVAAGCTFPLLTTLWIDRRVLAGDGPTWGLLATGAAASLGLAVAALHPYVTSPFVAVERDPRASLREVLEASAEQVRGRRVAVLGRFLALVAVGASGAALAGFGLWLTAPPAAVAAAHLYLVLKSTEQR